MTVLHGLSTRVVDGSEANLGVLSVHLEGQRCRVGCEFCYLGARVDESAEPLDTADIRNSLKSLMWRSCGVRRTGEGLTEALETVDGWRRYVLARQFDDLEGWELQNMLTLSRIMIQAALLREESRGVHLRTDFPQLDDTHWNTHLWFQRSEADSLERWGAAP